MCVCAMGAIVCYINTAIQTFVCSLCFLVHSYDMDATQLQFYDHSIIDFHLLYLYFSFQIHVMFGLFLFLQASFYVPLFFSSTYRNVHLFFILSSMCVQPFSFPLIQCTNFLCVSLSLCYEQCVCVCESCIEWGQRESKEQAHHTQSFPHTHTLFRLIFFV